MKLFNWFSKDKKSLLEGVSTSDISRSESSKTGLPPRKNMSLMDHMNQSVKEKFEVGGIGTVTLTREWETEFKNLGSAVNIPFYTSFNNYPIIRLHISDDYVSDIKDIINAVKQNWKPALYAKIFDQSQYPVLRSILCYRDNPKSPLLFESVLDIAEADFQDFYTAFMQNDKLDLIIKNNGQIIGFSCSYTEEHKLMYKREVDKMLEKYKQLKDFDGFGAASDLLMKVYTSANDGVSMFQFIDLEFAGEAKNSILTLTVAK